MALQQTIDVGVEIVGDGSSTSFAFDLLKDPYSVEVGIIANWFAEDRPAYRSVVPTGVSSGDPSTYSVSLSGTLVTTTFLIAPASGTLNRITAHLLFDSE